ncbi:MAG: galactose mutarotase [Pseudomonadota bacterium]|nr:galactose mutarotase [Pseudomonadota bacterium]
MKKQILGKTLCALLLTAPALAAANQASRTSFGNLPDGGKVEAISLDNGHGVTARVITLGASLQSLTLPDRNGHSADVVLAYPDVKDYVDKPQYFGATVGRFANRIAKGRFTLDGKAYQLPLNDGPNSLHGGTKGFDKVNWTVTKVTSSPQPSVTMKYVSPDGDQGYPGTLTVTATYTLTDSNELKIDYQATTDKPTIVNISNHTYWNLAGEGSGSVLDSVLTIPADYFTPVNSTLIPTGEFRAVAGTDFDFRQGKPIGRDIRDGKEPQLLGGHGYDMNWVISRKQAAKPRLVARVDEPKSGRVLSLFSAQPGLQFYSGNFLDGTSMGKSGHIYRQGDAFVLEPQMFPNTPNQPSFGDARLLPGQTYRNLIIYRFSVDKSAAGAH